MLSLGGALYPPLSLAQDLSSFNSLPNQTPGVAGESTQLPGQEAGGGIVVGEVEGWCLAGAELDTV